MVSVAFQGTFSHRREALFYKGSRPAAVLLAPIMRKGRLVWSSGRT
jgi:hypothetical protein